MKLVKNVPMSEIEECTEKSHSSSTRTSEVQTTPKFLLDNGISKEVMMKCQPEVEEVDADELADKTLNE